MTRRCTLLRPGVLAYDAAMELMRLLEARTQEAPETTSLVLLEHPSVITIGRNGAASNVLSDGGGPSGAARPEVRRTERGGDVTWHGPGQVVGYPVLHLREHRLSVKEYVRALEEVMIRVARRFDVAAERREGKVGVWVGDPQGGPQSGPRGGPQWGRKVGALGVRVRRHVTTHGFALNVANDLEPYRWIHPCGMPGAAVTTISAEVGRPVPMEAAFEACFRAFEEVFDVEVAG